jgi:hypothetical protein
VFFLSKANGASGGRISPHDIAAEEENTMSFHKITPVKKTSKAAPKPEPKKKTAKKAPKRPVGHQDR